VEHNTLFHKGKRMTTNDSPFNSGTHYEVQTNIQELGHVFTVGEIVVFKTSAYDPHNGVTRFWFAKEDGTQMNVWHVWDTAPPASKQWTTYFKECG